MRGWGVSERARSQWEDGESVRGRGVSERARSQ